MFELYLISLILIGAICAIWITSEIVTD